MVEIHSCLEELMRTSAQHVGYLWRNLLMTISLGNALEKPTASHLKSMRKYLEMILLFLLHHTFQSLFRNVVPLPDILSKLILSPVSKWTAMVLVLFGGSSSNNIPTILGSLILFVSHQAVSMINIVHMGLEVRC